MSDVNKNLIITREVTVYDKDGEPIDVSFGRLRTVSEDESVLNGILKELKIMNIHLSLITGERINHTEVE
jgi:hypothetical protein